MPCFAVRLSGMVIEALYPVGALQKEQVETRVPVAGEAKWQAGLHRRSIGFLQSTPERLPAEAQRHPEA